MRKETSCVSLTIGLWLNALRVNHWYNTNSIIILLEGIESYGMLFSGASINRVRKSESVLLDIFENLFKKMKSITNSSTKTFFHTINWFSSKNKKYFIANHLIVEWVIELWNIKSNLYHKNKNKLGVYIN